MLFVSDLKLWVLRYLRMRMRDVLLVVREELRFLMKVGKFLFFLKMCFFFFVDYYFEVVEWGKNYGYYEWFGNVEFLFDK